MSYYVSQSFPMFSFFWDKSVWYFSWKRPHGPWLDLNRFDCVPSTTCFDLGSSTNLELVVAV